MTVLFSDIRGFSTIPSASARRRSRRSSGVISARWPRRSRARRHDRQVPGRRRDGGLRGAEATPDHAERALRCALARADRPGELNSMGLGTDAVDGLHVGIGLNTGVVMAGAVGGGGRLEYTVIGDAVNVAQRLQSEAGAARSSPRPRLPAAPTVTAESIGPRVVKGARSRWRSRSWVVLRERVAASVPTRVVRSCSASGSYSPRRPGPRLRERAPPVRSRTSWRSWGWVSWGR